MDFRFRASKLQAKFISKGQVKEKIDTRKAREEERKKKEGKPLAFGPRNLTEYLFADKYGDIASDIDTREVNAVYLSYMQSLIDAYDRLKSKFNQL